MKKAIFAIVALALALACTPEANNPNESGEGGKDKTVHVTGISLDRTSTTIKEGESVTLIARVIPDNAYDKSVSWSSSDNTIASVDNSGKVTAKAKGNATIKTTANDGSGVSASCAVVVRGPCPAGAIDLGLSVYWATSNIGASTPEGYGDYYAWGETEIKEDYSWLTYKWGTEYSSEDFTKYCPADKASYWGGEGSPDGKTALDPEDDAAHVNLGGNWRMPTYQEWYNLIKKCTWTWTDNYNGTGVKGRIVTASNGNSIFLPAAGNRYGTSLYHAGSSGSYWTRSLLNSMPFGSWFVGFDSADVDWLYDNRSDGLSIRPVTE